MNFNFTTPGLLFPAVSLLLLADTNRFLALASVIRQLLRDYKADPQPAYLAQIDNLRRRIRLTRNMQFAGVLSLLMCTVCMFLLFHGDVLISEVVFALSLLSMIASLILSLMEIQISVKALDLHLQHLEHPEEITKQ
jgi:Protein of unknown function (DUF2721)